MTFSRWVGEVDSLWSYNDIILLCMGRPEYNNNTRVSRFPQWEENTDEEASESPSE